MHNPTTIPMYPEYSDHGSFQMEPRPKGLRELHRTVTNNLSKRCTRERLPQALHTHSHSRAPTDKGRFYLDAVKSCR